jgi:hypothetical protein
MVSAGPVPQEQWCHVAGVYDGDKIYVFIDGQKTSQIVGAGKGAAVSNSALQIGRALKSDGTGRKYLNGKIDELRVSSVARYTANFSPTNKNFTTDRERSATRLAEGSRSVSDGLRDRAPYLDRPSPSLPYALFGTWLWRNRAALL